MTKTFRWFARAAEYVAVSLVVLWAAGALYFDLPFSGFVRTTIAILWVAGVVAAWRLLPRCRARMAIILVFAGILAWWFSLAPKQERDWRPEVARLAHATIEGDTLTIYDLRNNSHHSASDFTPHYETRRYDLKKLQGLDLVLSKWRWSSGILGHPILSFDFGEDGHLAFSIEIRPEKDETFVTLPALYRQFEIIYIPADERDVIGSRAVFRPQEDVYLYRIHTTPERIQETLHEYIVRLNELYAFPEWYNLITANCATSIRTQRAIDRLPWDIRFLIIGHVDRMLYERGALDTSIPFDELKQRSYINEKAKAAIESSSADFSAAIRP